MSGFVCAAGGLIGLAGEIAAACVFGFGSGRAVLAALPFAALSITCGLFAAVNLGLI